MRAAPVVVGLVSLVASRSVHAEELTALTSALSIASASTAASQEVAATTSAAPAPESRYPREVLARPMTYPAGVATLGVDVNSIAHDIHDAADIRLVGGAGITDRIEVNFAHYEFRTDHASEGSFDFGLGLHLGMLLDDKLDLGLKLDSGYSLATDELDPLHVGMVGSYMLTPKLALLTPGDQLQLGLDSDHAVALAVPVALGYQVTPLFYLQLDTTLATFGLSDASTQVMFAHTTPVALTAFVNLVPTVDVFAGVSADLTPPDAPGAEDDAMASNTQVTDTLNVVVGARYYFGRM